MVNKVILIGNVGKDPEVKDVGDTKVASFSLATSKKWNKDGEKQEKTTWHTVKAWRGLAEVVANYVKKGDKVYIEGEIENRTWEQDGVKKYATDVVAINLQMLGGKPSGSDESSDKSSDKKKASDDQSLPF